MRNMTKSVNCQELNPGKSKLKVAACAQFDLSLLCAFQSTSHYVANSN